MKPTQNHVLEAVHRPIVLRQELTAKTSRPRIVQAHLEVLDGLHILIIDVNDEIHQLPTLLLVQVHGVGLQLRARCHQQTQALPRFSGLLRWECHQRVHAVRIDCHTDIGEDLKEQCCSCLDSMQPLKGVEVVRVTRATAVGEGGSDEADILAIALVRLVVIHPRELCQLWVHCVDVVEVHKVFRNELPIAFDFVVLDPAELQMVKVVAHQLLWQVTQSVRQWRRVWHLVEENHAREGVHTRDALQAKLILALLGCGRRGCRLQAAIQSVCPPMVWADELLATLRARGANTSAPVTTDIVEGVDFAVFVTRQDDRCAPDINDLHIAGVGKL
mmetsp:Transcript_89811/g.226603  ORF Transcript_89811/g.226603 Transcript_89811/m.226603 type:complete len:331 (-) Transcript_89811:336-1328(-)